MDQNDPRPVDRTNGELDAAVVAYRENPTLPNKERLFSAMHQHSDHFYREEIRGYQERTR